MSKKMSLVRLFGMWSLMVVGGGVLVSCERHNTPTFSFSSDKEITLLRFSNDGKRLLLAHPDGTVDLWNYQEGEVVASFATGAQALSDINWSPDGTKVIVASSKSAEVQLWDVTPGNKPSSMKSFQKDAGTTVRRAFFTPDGNNFVLESTDIVSNVWVTVVDVTTGSPTGVRVEKCAKDVVFSPDGSKMLLLNTSKKNCAQDSPGVVQVYDIAGGKMDTAYQEVAPVLSADRAFFTSDNGIVLIGKNNTKNKICFVSPGAVDVVQDGCAEIPEFDAEKMSYNRDSLLVADGQNGEWGIKFFPDLAKSVAQYVDVGAWSGDGQLMLSPSGSHFLQVRESQAFDGVPSYTLLVRNALTGEDVISLYMWKNNVISSWAFSKSGNQFAAVINGGSAVKIWDMTGL